MYTTSCTCLKMNSTKERLQLKTQELISKINEIDGYTAMIDMEKEEVLVKALDGGAYVGSVSTKFYGVAYTDSVFPTKKLTDAIQEDNRNIVLRYMLQYAITPLEERGDTKKYFVKLLPNEQGYLNVQEDTGYMRISDVIEADSGYKTKFTYQEYKKIQDKYPELLPEFDEDSPHFIEVQE